MAGSTISPNGIDAHDTQGVATNASELDQTYSYAALYIDQNQANEAYGTPGYDSSADGPSGGSLTAVQAATIEASGLKIVSIFETNGMAQSPYTSPSGTSVSGSTIVSYLGGSVGGVQQGTIDGQEAVASAEAIGQPTNTAIYFAIDFDPGPGSYTPGAEAAVETYFTNVSAALSASGYKVGVYGAGQTLEWAKTVPGVSYTWLAGSTGWAGYSDDSTDPDGTHGWTMLQSIPGLGNTYSGTASGVDVDYETTTATDYGQWGVCYVSGTPIRTVRGDVAVEHLSVDDLVVTASGEHRPIRWLGHRTIDCRAHPLPKTALPVRIVAHAFGPYRPARDILVSPGHAICVDILGEVLIPASSLLNGATVAQIDVATVTYWHVELDSHDILLADGLPAESYLECGNRAWFEGGLGTIDPHRPVGSPDGFCRPFVVSGPLVAGCREQLARRAEVLGWTISSDLDMHCLVDGTRVDAEINGGLAIFAIPAGATTVSLLSQTFVPALWEGSDDRRLGFVVTALRATDRSGHDVDVPLDEPVIAAGFHDKESTGSVSWRWTNGRLELPPDLWRGCQGDVTLHVHFSGATRRWIAPPVVEDIVRDDLSLDLPLRAA